MESGISIRESQVRKWLRRKQFKGEYLLVSTKPESEWSKELHSLPRDKSLIVDLYTPVLLEKALTFRLWDPLDWMNRRRARAMVKRFLERGDHFLVANRRQREYWIEESARLGVNLKHSGISVLPTGSGIISNLKSQISNLSRRHVVLWFGGIYPWMDPQKLVEVFSTASLKFPDWKLRFLGAFHPDTGYGDRYKKIKFIAFSKISESRVEFIPWQSEKNLGKYFVDVAFAVHLVKRTPEDYYAHRVRLLTLLNAGIGVLTSGRDVVSNLLVGSKAGMRIVRSEQLEQLLIKVMNEPVLIQQWSGNALKVEKIYLKQEADLNYIDD